MTYCTLLRGPVTEALAVALVDVHGLIAVPCPPCIMVDVTHHLGLYLHGKQDWHQRDATPCRLQTSIWLE